MRLPHGPYESGDVIYLLHTTASGTTAVGPLAVESCVPLEDGTHWRVECHRDGASEVSVTVGVDGLDQFGRNPAVSVGVARDGVIRASLQLAATEWDNGRQTADHSMSLDAAQDALDGALNTYVKAANYQRAGVIQ